MCAVGTIMSKHSLDKNNKKLFVNIIEESAVRGLHSFGLAHIQNDKLIVRKFYDMLACIDYFLKNVNASFIYHNRYSTSGDWQNHENNQPIHNDKDAIVFNGVISMKTKKGMEKEFGLRLENDNDGEIFLKNLKDPLSFIKKRGENISIAALFIKSNKVYAVRNHKRPLWYAKKNQCFYLSSTKDILKRSGFKKIKCTDIYTLYNYDKLNTEKKRIHRLSYPNDEQWGYRPSQHLPALHSE
jgi:glutamine phosphoribosylpyrophosphate amidotransferase